MIALPQKLTCKPCESENRRNLNTLLFRRHTPLIPFFNDTHKFMGVLKKEPPLWSFYDKWEMVTCKPVLAKPSQEKKWCLKSCLFLENIHVYDEAPYLA